jgi:hypothetical protein
MALSHINTIPTYHKLFQGITNLGYIEYFSFLSSELVELESITEGKVAR